MLGEGCFELLGLLFVWLWLSGMLFGGWFGLVVWMVECDVVNVLLCMV